MKNRSTLAMMVLALVLVSCGNDALPKPQAMLRLEYPKPEYSRVETNCSFTFEKNDLVRFVWIKIVICAWSILK